MSKPVVIRVETMEQMQQALAVRRDVFIREQGIDEAIEIDEHDRDPVSVGTALHVLVLEDGQPVATGRLLLAAEGHGEPHIGRVAVLSSERGKGYGRAVMQALHDLAREQGYEAVVLSAQSHAVRFYELLGYEARGEEYTEAGIPHREMRLKLR
jgi:predicted GNAT family N-acyltransferase